MDVGLESSFVERLHEMSSNKEALLSKIKRVEDADEHKRLLFKLKEIKKAIETAVGG